jgi:hypothetical protein
MIPSQAAPPEPTPTAGLSAPGHSPDGLWWWDGSVWHSAVSPDGAWWWDGAAWTPRSATRSTSQPRIWLRRLSLLGSFAALIFALVYALHNMSDIYQNGNIPSGPLLGALIASLLLWIGAIALGWRLRKSLYLWSGSWHRSGWLRTTSRSSVPVQRVSGVRGPRWRRCSLASSITSAGA